MSSDKTDLVQLRKNFIKFVGEKPSDEEVVHQRGWDSCAVGEYHAVADYGHSDVGMQKFAEDLFGGEEGRVYEALNEAGCGSYAPVQLNTYGELHEFLVKSFDRAMGEFK